MNRRRRQGGWIHFRFTDCVWAVVFIAFAGWAVIEGAVWVFHHVRVAFS